MKVFISHAVADRPLARRVADMLSARGFEVWDDRQILPGDNWAAEVGRALTEAAAMVVLLSPTALKSEHVRREILYALGQKEYSGRVVPVLTVPLDALPKEDFPWILKKIEMVRLGEFSNEEAGIQRIAELLQDADLMPS